MLARSIRGYFYHIFFILSFFVSISCHAEFDLHLNQIIQVGPLFPEELRLEFTLVSGRNDLGTWIFSDTDGMATLAVLQEFLMRPKLESFLRNGKTWADIKSLPVDDCPKEVLISIFIAISILKKSYERKNEFPFIQNRERAIFLNNKLNELSEFVVERTPTYQELYDVAFGWMNAQAALHFYGSDLEKTPLLSMQTPLGRVLSSTNSYFTHRNTNPQSLWMAPHLSGNIHFFVSGIKTIFTPESEEAKKTQNKPALTSFGTAFSKPPYYLFSNIHTGEFVLWAPKIHEKVVFVGKPGKLEVREITSKRFELSDRIYELILESGGSVFFPEDPGSQIQPSYQDAKGTAAHFIRRVRGENEADWATLLLGEFLIFKGHNHDLDSHFRVDTAALKVLRAFRDEKKNDLLEVQYLDELQPRLFIGNFRSQYFFEAREVRSLPSRKGGMILMCSGNTSDEESSRCFAHQISAATVDKINTELKDSHRALRYGFYLDHAFAREWVKELICEDLAAK